MAAGHVVSTVGPIAGPAVAPKRWEEVARFLTAAVAARPSSFMAHNNLGVALRSKGDLDEAIAEYRAAVRLHPDFYLPHTNLGLALESKGDLDGAIAEFREAIRLKPDHAMAHTNLVDALESKGDLDGAIAEFRARLRLRPDDALTHYSLGKVLRPKGDLDGAIAEFRTAVRLQPDFYWAHNNLAFALIAKGKVDEMVPVLRLAIEKKPGDPNLRHRLAVALLLTNDRAGYRRACAATVQQFGRSTARTLGEAGRSCLISPEALDDLSVPRRLAELAEDRQTRPHWWLYVQGLAHYRACQYEQAVECLTKSMEVGRTWKAVALNWPVLAMAHHRLGHADEARRYLEKAHDTRGDKARDIQPGEVMSSQADWFDRAEFQFLLREAEELILRSAFPDDPFQP